MMGEPRPYADAADLYWRAGWANPIPVVGKFPPPRGFTGHDGRNVSWPDLCGWRDGPEAGHNIALRLPASIVGVDVDAHDGRAGAASLAAAEAELGPLPPTVRSTARSPAEASGIRLYRVPASASLRGAEKRFRARFGEGVDIIRHDHRYAVVWPSVHPETGTVYRWYLDDEDAPLTTVPRVGDGLPTLPARWVEFLEAATEGASSPAVPGSVLTDESATAGSVWDTLPRQFTHDEAVAFCRPRLEALRTAPTGTINNRLNEAAFVLGRFVPAFFTPVQATRWLMWALAGTAYDGKTWRAEATIASGLGAAGWKAVRVEASTVPTVLASVDHPAAHDVAGVPTVSPTGGTEPTVPVRRGDFTGVGQRRRVEPAYLRRADGRPLLYPGKDSYLYAETESGKSWLTVLAVTQCIEAGVPVLVVDFEEGDEIEYGTRLLTLGMSEAKINDPARFRYLMVDGRATLEILAEAEDMNAAVVIYEGMSVAYDVYGLQVKENDSATAFRRTLVKPHLVAGRCVLTTDHVVKDRDARGRYAIGGVMKLNAASGGAFLLVNVEGLAPGRRGASNLYVTKDRPGGVKRYGVAAGERWDPQVRRVGTLVVDDSRSLVNFTDVQVLAPAAEEVTAPAEATLTDRVLSAIAAVAASGRAPTLRAVRSEVGGRPARVADEVERLLTRGVLRETSGPRGARVLIVHDRFPDLEGDER